MFQNKDNIAATNTISTESQTNMAVRELTGAGSLNIELNNDGQ